MLRPHRVPVSDAFGVVPHPITVDEARARVRGDLEHAPVDVGGHPRQHRTRRLAEIRRPPAPHEVVVATDATARDDDRRRRELEPADDVAVRRDTALRVVGSEDAAAHAGDGASTTVGRGLDDEFVDAMTVRERQQAPGLGIERLLDEGAAHARAGAPRDVEAGHRVAVTPGATVASLGPPDHWRELDSVLAQPLPLAAGRPLDVGARPALSPDVLTEGLTGRVRLTLEAVPLGAAAPVLPRELEAVAHPQAALLGRVDEEQPTERPVRLSAQIGAILLLDDDDAAPPRRQFGRRDETCQPRAHDDRVETLPVHAHLQSLVARTVSGRRVTSRPVSNARVRCDADHCTHGFSGASTNDEKALRGRPMC